MRLSFPCAAVCSIIWQQDKTDNWQSVFIMLSLCCVSHFVFLCSCTLRQKWNHADTREKCPAQVHRVYAAWACSQPTHLVSVASDGYEPEMVQFRLWMHCTRVWDLCSGSNQLQKPLCFETEYFFWFCVAVQGIEKQTLSDITVCPGEQPVVAGINVWSAT